ncbi:tagaturonate epimerase family protein [Lederbergia sp. NSJ-179]|uniref:tagaturonate epimerase family protein n=1 Tax=Lederbergia sp. NSJ-179 TaxID=2931402 RepID=UPI001FD50271|nr:tagaturonate epimerase family protein [Lederbergia sp. NSJ-179]MCJ7840713.1 tagaturonate epimerase family protein [Lederbergia sp. NSJ-179]
MNHLVEIMNGLETGEIPASADVKIYDQSHTEQDGTHLLMVHDQEGKWLLAVGDGPIFKDLQGTIVSNHQKVCPLSHENRLVLNRYFDYTVPRAFGTKTATMGLGDRLGLASPGHIETVRQRTVKPILAQQSIRELTLLNRTMEDMLDAASFAVFQEGYKEGFGADGDHIKEEKDIEYALSLGVSMLTLDCSDHIPKQIDSLSADKLATEFEQLDEETKTYFKKEYLNQTFSVNGLSIHFDENSVMKNVLQYAEALDYMAHVYHTYIQSADRTIDFEISIDETETITSPQAHFFVANELRNRGVRVTSLAPRFCGEFQKGIDYIGDIEQFERELEEHALIAEYFGYKLSIHSGSDKFKVFPIIAKYTKGILHIKTAGTNWLEAVRVIANTNPSLYRRMHAYALEHFKEALAYYHVTPDLASVTPLDQVSDEELALYMNDDAARQLFHVTYGILLTATNEEGRYIFKDEFFETLNRCEDVYRKALVYHIGKHVDLLGL